MLGSTRYFFSRDGVFDLPPKSKTLIVRVEIEALLAILAKHFPCSVRVYLFFEKEHHPFDPKLISGICVHKASLNPAFLELQPHIFGEEGMEIKIARVLRYIGRKRVLLGLTELLFICSAVEVVVNGKAFDDRVSSIEF